MVYPISINMFLFCTEFCNENLELLEDLIVVRELQPTGEAADSQLGGDGWALSSGPTEVNSLQINFESRDGLHPVLVTSMLLQGEDELSFQIKYQPYGQESVENYKVSNLYTALFPSHQLVPPSIT